MENVIAENHQAANIKLWRRDADNYAEKTVTIINSVSRNAGEAGIKISEGAKLKLYNSVVYNSGEEGVAFRAPKGHSQPVVTSEIINSIIINSGYSGVDLRSGNDLIANHNIYLNNRSGHTNGFSMSDSSLTEDPQFFGAGSGDFRILSDSPAVGAGVPLAEVETDFEGDSRPADGPFDIGIDQRRPEPSGNSPAAFTAPQQLMYSVNEGETLTISLEATDPDDNQMKFSTLNDLPVNSSLDALTGEFVFTPDFSQGGNTDNPSSNYEINFVVSDVYVSELDIKTIQITVNHINREPSYEGQKKYTLIEDRPFMLKLSGHDQDDDAIDYSISGELPEGLQLNSNTGEIIGTTSETGTFSVTVHIQEDTPDAFTYSESIEFEVLPEAPYQASQAIRNISVSTSAELNSALSNARAGDHILLMSGEYNSVHNISASGTRENPIVIAAAPGQNPVLDGSGRSSPEAFNFNNRASHIILDGLTIQNEGESLYFRNSHENITVLNTSFENASFGLYGGSINELRVENVSIKNMDDRGIYLGSIINGHFNNVTVESSGDRNFSTASAANDNIHILNSTFTGSGRNGVLIRSKSFHARNSVISDTGVGLRLLSGGAYFVLNNLIHQLNYNGSRAVGISASPNAWAVIENNTIADSDDYGIDLSDGVSYLRLRNTVVADADDYSLLVRGSGADTQIEENNLFEGDIFNYSPDSSTLRQDPGFVTNGADFRPASNSPLIDAGQAIDYIQTDINSASRPVGNNMDIGAYEYQDRSL